MKIRGILRILEPFEKLKKWVLFKFLGARRMRGKYAESTRSADAYSPRILRVFSAYSPRILRTFSARAENAQRIRGECAWVRVISPRPICGHEKHTQSSTYCIMLLQDEGGGWWAVWRNFKNSSSLVVADFPYFQAPAQCWSNLFQEFKRQMHMMNPMNQYSRGWDQNYYDNNYQRNECMFGCPMNSHCEWGFCECNAGTSRLKVLHQLVEKNLTSRLTKIHQQAKKTSPAALPTSLTTPPTHSMAPPKSLFCECNAKTLTSSWCHQEVRSMPVRLDTDPQLHPTTTNLWPI